MKKLTSVQEALCRVLGNLGQDETWFGLSGYSEEQLYKEINAHVAALEKRAVEEFLFRELKKRNPKIQQTF